MASDFIPDYSGYSAEELMNMYMKLDKGLNPELTRAIEDELKLKMISFPQVHNDSGFVQFIKKRKWWIAGIAVVLFINVFSRQIFYTPGETPSAFVLMLPIILHLIVLSVLFYFAAKGEIIAGVFMALYLIYIFFGSMIF